MGWGGLKWNWGGVEVGLGGLRVELGWGRGGVFNAHLVKGIS